MACRPTHKQDSSIAYEKVDSNIIIFSPNRHLPLKKKSMSADEASAEKIAAFLKDLSSTEIKHGFKNSLNIFEAAGLARQETKHSRMLAFLLDPTKGHCLDAEVFKGLVLKNYESIISPQGTNVVRATKLILDGLGDLFVECEWKNIDVLAYSESLKLLVAIENKIDARESSRDGTSQLQRYANLLENDPKFAQYSKLFLFLTIDGEDPSDKRWTTITHEDVLTFVEQPFIAAKDTGAVTAEADFFVRNYIDFLRRKIVSNPLLEEDCRLIYQRHKELLDMIIDIVGAKGGVSDFAQAFSEETDTKIFANRSGKFAYLPSSLVNSLPDETLERPWWGQQKPILFWFYINNEKQKLKLIFQVGPMKDKQIRKKLVDTLVETFQLDRSRKTTDQYTVIVSHTVSVDPESENLLEKMVELHERFKPHLPLLSQLISEFDFVQKT